MESTAVPNQGRVFGRGLLKRNIAGKFVIEDKKHRGRGIDNQPLGKKVAKRTLDESVALRFPVRPYAHKHCRKKKSCSKKYAGLF